MRFKIGSIFVVAVLSAVTVCGPIGPISNASAEPRSGDNGNHNTKKQATDNSVSRAAYRERELTAKKNTKEPGKTCNNKKRDVANKIRAYSSAAQSKLARTIVLHDRMESYAANNRAVNSIYQSHAEDLTSRKVEAERTVLALSEAVNNMNCADLAASTDFKTIKELAQNARDALYDYRMEIKRTVVGYAQNKAGTNRSQRGDGSETAPKRSVGRGG